MLEGNALRLSDLNPYGQTGNSKHYAFIEFEHEEVADIVAEAMDGYLLFNHILKCERVPPEKACICVRMCSVREIPPHLLLIRAIPGAP